MKQQHQKLMKISYFIVIKGFKSEEAVSLIVNGFAKSFTAITNGICS